MPIRSFEVKTGGRPKRPRRSMTTVLDGPGLALTPRSRNASAGRRAPPTTAPAPPRCATRRASSIASTPWTFVCDRGSLSCVGSRRAPRSNRRRTIKPAQATTIVSMTTMMSRLSRRLPQKLWVWGVWTCRWWCVKCPTIATTALSTSKRPSATTGSHTHTPRRRYRMRDATKRASALGSSSSSASSRSDRSARSVCTSHVPAATATSRTPLAVATWRTMSLANDAPRSSTRRWAVSSLASSASRAPGSTMHW